jgi:hypothetical protein
MDSAGDVAMTCARGVVLTIQAITGANSAFNAALKRTLQSHAQINSTIVRGLYAKLNATLQNAPASAKEVTKTLSAEASSPLVFIQKMTLLNLAAISGAALTIKRHATKPLNLIQAAATPTMTKLWGKTLAAVKVKASSRIARASALTLSAAGRVNILLSHSTNYVHVLFQYLTLTPGLTNPKTVVKTLTSIAAAVPVTSIRAIKNIMAKTKASALFTRAAAMTLGAIALSCAVAERRRAFTRALYSQTMTAASLGKLKRLVLTLTAIAITAPCLTFGALKNLTARAKASGVFIRAFGLVLRAASLPDSALERRHAFIRLLSGKVIATAAIDKILRLLLTLNAVAKAAPISSLAIFKTAIASLQAAASIKKTRCAALALAAIQTASAELFKKMSLLKLITTQVLSISVLEKARHLAMTLLAISMAQGAKALDVGKGLFTPVKSRLTLNRAWANAVRRDVETGRGFLRWNHGTRGA